MASKKRLAQYKRLMKAVHDILLQEWDPLFAADVPKCVDEYDTYIGVICRLLVEGVDESRLAAHLAQVQTIAMGVSWVDEERDKQVARKLLTLTL